MQSILTCALIKESKRDGTGEPRYVINGDGTGWCEGFATTKINDEPCDTCKECKFCVLND